MSDDAPFTLDLGGLRIHMLHDATLPIPRANFTGPVDEVPGIGDSVPVALNAVLIEAEDGRLCLVDTGIGTAIPGAEGALFDRLAQLGVAPERIGTILLSHFHIDHVGGLVTRPERFAPDARLLATEPELAWWTQPGFPAGAPEGQGRSRPIVARLIEELGARIETVPADAELMPGVTLVPLPGHTPGHTGLRLQGRRRGLFLWGDVVHAPALQCAEPAIGYVADVDGAAAAALRRRVFASVADEEALVAGFHLPGPGLGRLVTASRAYRFEPDGG